ncbi:MAG: biotin/lipoyl-binding carrier protein [Burkholderiaceae bacterium]
MNKIAAEVTGMVWKVEAKVGDRLQADDVIMILESMKMEIPVMAPDAGVLSEILVAEGEPIREGQIVAVMAGA